MHMLLVIEGGFAVAAISARKKERQQTLHLHDMNFLMKTSIQVIQAESAKEQVIQMELQRIKGEKWMLSDLAPQCLNRPSPLFICKTPVVCKNFKHKCPNRLGSTAFRQKIYFRDSNPFSSHEKFTS